MIHEGISLSFFPFFFLISPTRRKGEHPCQFPPAATLFEIRKRWCPAMKWVTAQQLMGTSSWLRTSEFDNHIWNEFSFIMREVDMCHSNGTYKQSKSKGWVTETGRGQMAQTNVRVHPYVSACYLQVEGKSTSMSFAELHFVERSWQAELRVPCVQGAASESQASWPWAGL